MRNSNGMKERENEDVSINRLAAQWKLYNEAKCWENLNFVLCVFLPLALSFLHLIVQEQDALDAFLHLLSLSSIPVSFLFKRNIRKKKELGAEIQQAFDVYVYQMPWDIKLFGERRNLDYLVAEKSRKLLPQKECLRNWYPPEMDTMQINVAIFFCQRSNYTWDIQLRRRYQACGTVMISVFSIVVFGTGILRSETVASLLSRAAFVSPMLSWLFDMLTSLSEDIQNLNSMEAQFMSFDTKTMEQLQEIQKSLYEHRKHCTSIPNFFYRMFRGSDEELMRDMARMQQ